MFNRLYKLFKSKSNKTPLEDYVTEIFVGILNQDEKIKNGFCKSFLGLSDDDVYEVSTQESYTLPNDPNCRIDIQIKGRDTLCFIESKVNSKEGYEQLARYIKVLDNCEYQNTRLIYCTRDNDRKPYTEHKFKQYRWYEIAKFLNSYTDNNIAVHDFLSFLDNHNMTKDFSLSTSDFSSISNLKDLLKKTQNTLERVSDYFDDTFYHGIERPSDRKIKLAEIIDKLERIVFRDKNVVDCSNKYSDFKYGFLIQNPTIYVSIWLERGHSNYKEFKKLAESTESTGDSFIYLSTFKEGIAIELKKDLSTFQDDNDIDQKIAEWFMASFDRFADLIRENPQINWNLNCPPKI